MTTKAMIGMLRACLAVFGVMFFGSSALFADVSVSLGLDRLTVIAPPADAGNRLTLVWDNADKGDDIATWAHSYEIEDAVPSAGATYELVPSELGLAEGQFCRIIAHCRCEYLEMLKMPSTATYIDTGIKDTDCYGVCFGFYGTESNSSWGYFIGSVEANGFAMGMNNTDYASWNWAYRVGKFYPRPSVKTDSINLVSFENAVFTLNGTKIDPISGTTFQNTPLEEGSVGKSGQEISIGRNKGDWRYLHGWWSYVRFVDADGKNLIDYIPARRKGTGDVFFWDRVSGKPVYSTGGGAFTAGSATGDEFEFAGSQKAFVATGIAPIIVSFRGSRLVANVPAHCVGDTLLLLWDDVNKGDDIDAWANSYELAASVRTGGGSYSVDLGRLGVRNGQACAVVALQQFEPLDMLKMPSAATYIDTGIKDTDCYGVCVGFYGTESNSDSWGYFIGSRQSDGFSMGSPNNGNQWRFAYGNHGNWYPILGPHTDSINTVSFENAVFTFNGSVITPLENTGAETSLPAGSVGRSGQEISVGRNKNDSRILYGWWSYVRFQDVNGEDMIDYIPVKRMGDGKACFYDNVAGRFVESTGGGAFTAGTVTGAAQSLVHSRVDVVAPFAMDALVVTVEGEKVVVKVPASFSQEQVLLLWDETDKGDAIDEWTHQQILVETVPAAGGIYEANWQSLGIGKDHICRVVAVHRLQLLDMLKMTDFKTMYVDTGIQDSDCYGVQFGFYGNESPADWGTIIGSQEGPSPATAASTGFVVSMSGAAYNSWFWYYRNWRSPNRPAVNTDSINDVSFADGSFTINGALAYDATLPAGPVAETGRNIFVGTTAQYCQSRAVYGWWSYVKLQDAAGSDIADYIPAKRISDDAVGFYDRATLRFVLSTGGGAFTDGTVTNESYVAVRDRATVSLASAVVAAEWTGAGAAGRLDDPENWSCTNPFGETVVGVPDANTVVTFSSADAFNCPAGTAFKCKSITLNGSLTADRDWRGLDFATVGGSFDLCGHALSVSMNSDLVRSCMVTDSVGGGELRVGVPNGARFSNASVVLSGKLKLVKVGDGTFIAAKKSQAYSGGTEVAEGTFACGGMGAEGVYGAASSLVTVDEGATFDCNGFANHYQNPFELAGGTLINTVDVAEDGVKWFADVTLTADSFANAVKTFGFSNLDYAEAKLEMNDHVLTIDVDGAATFLMANLTVTGGGTICQRTGGFIRLGGKSGETAAGIRAEDTVLDVSRSVCAHADSVVSEYISRYQGGWDQGEGKIQVINRFCPMYDNGVWHSVELQDGAVLDLSNVTTVWNAYCKGVNFEHEQTLTCAANATVTVEVGTRQPILNDQLVAWKVKPAGATFVWDLDLPLHAKGKGLFVMERPGTAILIR